MPSSRARAPKSKKTKKEERKFHPIVFVDADFNPIKKKNIIVSS